MKSPLGEGLLASIRSAIARHTPVMRVGYTIFQACRASFDLRAGIEWREQA
jgi:hypothetical protein